jgi:outer membrane protein assembly factor BamA
MAHVVMFVTSCLLAGNTPIQAQNTTPLLEAEESCSPSSASYDKKPSGPQISVAGVTFSGFLRMPVSDQDEIVASIKEQQYEDPLDGVTDEALERVKVGWQNHGYFKVQVNGYATELDSTPAGRRIALSVQVDEGLQYRLGGIEFKGNRAVANLEVLRALFPTKDGDIFSKAKIGIGLDNLRKAYGELGYINFTPVPNTRFDDEKKLINLDIDVDEGKQFFVDGVNIIGVDESFRAHQMLQDLLLKPGQIYNGRLVDLFLKREHGSVPSDCECNDRPLLQLDERAGLVTISFDFGFCLSGR